MDTFVIQYETQIKPQIEKAIENSLQNEVAKAAVSALEDSAQQRVYDAYPDAELRRYSLLDDNTYDCVAQGTTLTITALTSFQGTDTGDDLGDVIAEGLPNYHMPFPRPWMEDGIQDRITQIEKALEDGLKRQGF